MNQILKARGARSGEVSNGTETEAETQEGPTAAEEAKGATGVAAKSKPCETAAVEDWSITLQMGLWLVLEWQQFMPWAMEPI